MLPSTPQTTPAGFHHVNISVSKVSEMEMFRDEHQNIRAMANVKMSREDAEKLMNLLKSHLVGYQDGMGPITFALEGEFT